MSQLNRVNVPTTPGIGTGVGAPSQQPAIPAGNPLRSTTGLATRTTNGPGPMRNAALPTSGAPAGGAPRMGPRPMPAPQAAQSAPPKQPMPALGTGIGSTRPAQQPLGSRPGQQPAGARPASGPSASARPATPPPVPAHTSSLPGQKPQAQARPQGAPQTPASPTGLPTPPPSPTTPTMPASTAQPMDRLTAAPAMPTPMQSTALSLMEHAVNDAIAQGVDPMVAMQACMQAWGVPQGGANGMSGMSGAALAMGSAGVGEAQFAMDSLMGEMKQIMMIQMKSQTEMAIMKMIVDMNMALAKEIKKSGQAVKDLAG